MFTRDFNLLMSERYEILEHSLPAQGHAFWKHCN
jgi:hypothetical protein